MQCTATGTASHGSRAIMCPSFAKPVYKLTDFRIKKTTRSHWELQNHSLLSYLIQQFEFISAIYSQVLKRSSSWLFNTCVILLSALEMFLNYSRAEEKLQGKQAKCLAIVT